MLLDEDSLWLRPYVNPTVKSNRKFWEELDDCPDASPPDAVRNALEGTLPRGSNVLRFATRTKGGGSLGRPRYLVIARWNTGRVVREAKACVLSAWSWAHGSSASKRTLDAAFGAFRSPDPHLRLEAGFVLRRIAPDSRKIDIDDVQDNGLTKDLLAAMAGDLAAVHAASGDVPRITEDLRARRKRWLQDATEIMKDAVTSDFTDFTDFAALA